MGKPFHRLVAGIALSWCIVASTHAAESNQLATTTADLMQTTTEALSTTPPPPEAISKIYNETKALLEQSQMDQARTALLEAEIKSAPERREKLNKALAEEPVLNLEPPAPDTSMEVLEQLYSAAKERFDAAERERTKKANRIHEQERLTSELPDLMSMASAKLEKEKKLQNSPLPTDDPPGRARAEGTRRKAAIIAAETAITLHENERSNTSSLGGILQSELSLAQRNLDHAKSEEQHWLDVLKKKRKEQGFEWIKKTEDQMESFADKDPMLTALCLENIAFAKKASDPGGVIDCLRIASTRRNDISSLLTQLNTDFEDIQSRLHLTGMNKAVGNLLIQHRNALPQIRTIKVQLAESRQELNEAQFTSLQLREEIKKARRDGSILLDLRTNLKLEESSIEWFGIEKDASSILKLRRELLTQIAQVNAKYERELSETIVTEQDLLRTAENMQTFVDEEVLWMRNMPALGINDCKVIAVAITTAEFRPGIIAFLNSTREHALAHPVRSFMLLLISFCLLMLQRKARKIISREALQITEHPPGTLSDTFATLFWTGISALSWPAILVLFIQWLERSQSSADVILHVTEALKIVTFYILPMIIIIEIARKDGLAIVQLKLDPVRVSAFRKLSLLILCFCFPFLLIRSLAQTYPANHSLETIARLGSIIGQLFMAGTYAILLRRNGPFVAGSDPDNKKRLIYRKWIVWYTLITSTPLLLVVASAAGFQYSAIQIGGRVNGMVLMIVGLFTFQATVTRIVWLLRRKRLQEEVHNRKKEGKEVSNEATQELQKDLLKEAVLGVTSASDGIVNLVRFATWALLAGGLYLMWKDILPAFHFLDRTNLYAIGDVQVTLGGLLAAIVTIIIGSTIVRTVPGMLEIYILPRTRIAPGERSAIATLLKYILVVIIVLTVCSHLGLTWSSMSWMMAAMGVGIGFGLQEIFANLISGIMLLMDGRIRPLDIITVGEASGRVTAIRTLATTVTDWNNRELVIPNKEFVTGRVINWTLSEQTIRLDIAVGVAYGSDKQKVEEILLRLGRANEHTLNNPPPEAMFMEFGDNSLNYELRVWLSMDKRLTTRHELNRAIDDAFNEAGVTIAFPQLDIHVDSENIPARPEPSEPLV